GWVLRRIDGDEGSNRGRNLMVGFHDTDDDAIRGGISRAWKISKESEYAGAYEFKLKGRPFLAGGVDTVAARQMVLGMCEELERARGYLLSNTYTLSARQGSQSSLVFKIPSIGQDEYGRGGRSSTYLGISLNSGDDIRLIPAPGEPLDFVARDEIGRGIAETWPRGVQKEGMYGESYEWKLRGYPWLADGTDTVDARLLVGRIIGIMQSLGFELMPKIDCSGKLADLSFMMFRRPPTALRTLPPPPVLCLSLHTYDRVRLTCTDTRVVEEVSSRVRASLGPPHLPVDVVESSRWYGRALEFKISGWPFHGMMCSQTALAAGLVILTMIDALRELGWELKASLDVSGKCLGGGGVVLLTVVYCPFPSLFFAPQWDA
ncbi:hypothetical protein FOZ63_008078, partial [Perkinsus olseni]